MHLSQMVKFLFWQGFFFDVSVEYPDHFVLVADIVNYLSGRNLGSFRYCSPSSEPCTKKSDFLDVSRPEPRMDG